MPAAHSIVTGSILNKHVSQADDKWDQPWDEISEAMRVYAVADIERLCGIRGGLPAPGSISRPGVCVVPDLVEQKEFVAMLNTLLLESLVGTEIQTTDLVSARTREDVAKCI